jgi:predicted RNA-binding Zn ribbon-like protein
MDRVPEFFWVGNHPGLDLLNTAAADDNAEPVELLDGFDALASWLDEAQLVTPIDVCAVPARQRPQVLRWTRRLRDAGRQIVDREVAGADDHGSLDAVVAEVPVRLAHSVGSECIAPVVAAAPHDRIRLALALAVLEATRLDPSRVRRCGREGCVLLFFDVSKNSTRRWCDMAVCGNRVKAAAHYQRHRPGTPRRR